MSAIASDVTLFPPEAVTGGNGVNSRSVSPNSVPRSVPLCRDATQICSVVSILDDTVVANAMPCDHDDS